VRALPMRLRTALALGSAARALDRAARAPAGAQRVPPAALAGLAGVRPADFLRSTPAEQRAARVAIERELRRRRELLEQARPAVLRLLRRAPADDRGRGGAPAGAAETALARRRRQFGRQGP